MALAAGELDGEPLLTAESVQGLFAPAMVGGDGGPLQDPLAARCLGCTTYYFRGHRIVEASGAAPGSRALLLLAPDDDLGLIVLANRDLTALPEAVRNEFLEQIFGAAGRNLQADARALEAQWQAQRTLPEAAVGSLRADPCVDGLRRQLRQ
jgi:CubicO group peptidase (beta-lactamase class C family)